MLCVPTAFMKSLLLPCAGSASMAVLKMWFLGKMEHSEVVGETPLEPPPCPLPAPVPPLEELLPPWF